MDDVGEYGMSETSARVDQKLWDKARSITEDLRLVVQIYYALVEVQREAMEMDSKDVCEWIEDEGGDDWNYSTKCGREFGFYSGSPSENNFEFCPYCGLRLEVVDEQAKDKQ